MEQVPFNAFEATCTRLELIIRRLTIALIVCIILIFVNNVAWVYAWMQYDYESETVETVYTQDGEGLNIIGDRNHVAE